MDAVASTLNSENPAEPASCERLLIWAIEDNRADVFLMRDAIQKANVPADLQVMADGDQAIALVDRVDADASVPCPALILLDLNLPRKSGTEVLQHLRRSRRCGDTPVVIVTSSDSQDDKFQTAQLGASRYFRKPSSYESFIKIGEIIRDVLMGPMAGILRQP